MRTRAEDIGGAVTVSNDRERASGFGSPYP